MGAKLGDVIGSLLRVVPGSNDGIFFCYKDEIACLGEVTTDNVRMEESDDFMAADVQSFTVETDIPQQHASDSPPLFFRITLNQKLVSLNKILALKKSATIAVQVLVFPDLEKKLSHSHESVVSKLQRALNSFAAEQVLDKLR